MAVHSEIHLPKQLKLRLKSKGYVMEWFIKYNFSES